MKLMSRPLYWIAYYHLSVSSNKIVAYKKNHLKNLNSDHVC